MYYIFQMRRYVWKVWLTWVVLVSRLRSSSPDICIELSECTRGWLVVLCSILAMCWSKASFLITLLLSPLLDRVDSTATGLGKYDSEVILRISKVQSLNMATRLAVSFWTATATPTTGLALWLDLTFVSSLVQTRYSTMESSWACPTMWDASSSPLMATSASWARSGH